MLHGSCLCRTVRYEISGPIGPASHCHCSQCRKGHGAAFASYAALLGADFRFTSGADAVARYQASPHATRTFCRHCGSNLQWCGSADRERLSVALGTLDDDPRLGAACHIFVASKAPWYAIGDSLPQFAADPPRDPA